jgi:hypothetical protein
MCTVRQRVLGTTCAFLLAAIGATAARPAEATVIGVADQNAAALAHPLLAWSGIRTARVVAPWDAALQSSPELAEWLAVAQARGIEPLVTFGHRRGEDCRRVRCVLPTPDQMRTAMRAFRARWPHVTTFSTWNEANHPGQPTADQPGAAARLYEAVVAECPGCTVLAIEVLDISSMDDWLAAFRRSLRSSPQLWGLQNYGDATRNRTTMTDRMMQSVPGQVWVTETGGIVRHLLDGEVRWPYDEERARASVARALSLADRHAARIGRAYFYQWQAASGDAWDSGLLRPDGTPRPSFHELAKRLRPGEQVPTGDAPLPVAPSGGKVVVGSSTVEGVRPPLVFLDDSGRELLRLVRRPWISRQGFVRAGVLCPRGQPSPCRARLTVRTRRRASRPGPVLARTRRTVRPGRTVTIGVRLAAAERRRIRRGQLRRVVVEIAVANGPRWAVDLKTSGPRRRKPV